MIQCSSCKNKTSDERCPSKSLSGLLFCGKHAKVKSIRLWKDVNNIDEKIILIQKAWRGYSVRNWIHLAGPGVLSRSVCHNEEELVSLDKPSSVDPLNYFSFEEGGKVYWFDIRSISEHCLTSVKPTNPYTRDVLSFDTRRRLRTLCIRRHKRGISNHHTADTDRTANQVIMSSWNTICQIIEENGFFDMNPMHFASLNRARLFVFNTMIRNDMISYASEHKTPNSRRKKYVNWLKRLLREYANGIDQIRFLYLTSKVLVAILNDAHEQYPICFIIMSALHRL
jgi:IQ calmodulin-binding motif